ncbi:MAG: hypothetical protein V4760_04165 [Bdellovibrionota bacterium]
MTTFENLLETDLERRDDSWERDFLKAFPSARVKVLNPEPQVGPDHWPYLLTTTEAADDTAPSILTWLSTRGIGLVLNPQKPHPDYVLSYGMIWNFRERGEFLSLGATGEKPASNRFDIKPGQELMAGAPSEAFLPKYVRSVIRQFLADQGVFTPKVLMISADKVNYDLCFSIESLKSPPTHEHANIAEALSWFLPAHYTVALVSEKTVSGFVSL